MIKKVSFQVLCSVLLLTMMASSHNVSAATPAGRDKLRIHTSAAEKNGESLLSLTVQWRIDGNLTYESTGIAFANGPDRKKPTTGSQIASKLVTAITDGMVKQYPSWRGANPVQKGDFPELTINNKEGFSLTKITLRDYTNAKATYDLVDKSFAAAGVDIAIDLVYAAAVEYVYNFDSVKAKMSSAAGGGIDISIDGGQTINVATKGKTTEQIEQEIANKLSSAQLSHSVIYPHTRDGDARNSKPFDGSEVQLLALPAKSITIHVKDPSLGVLNKFKFADKDAPLQLVKPIMGLLLVGAIGAFVFFFGGWFIKGNKEEQESE